jgi:hypothetical protein
MGDNVKRFSPYWGGETHAAIMGVCDYGRYVLASDYDALKTELEAANQHVRIAQDFHKVAVQQRDAAWRENESLAGQVERVKARLDQMDAGYEASGEWVRKEIRAALAARPAPTEGEGVGLRSEQEIAEAIYEAWVANKRTVNFYVAQRNQEMATIAARTVISHGIAFNEEKGADKLREVIPQPGDQDYITAEQATGYVRRILAAGLGR